MIRKPLSVKKTSTPRKPPGIQPRVVGEDGEDGDGAETVEGRPIAELEGFGGPRHDGEWSGKKLARSLVH